MYWRNGDFIEGNAPERGSIGVFDTLLADHGILGHADDHYARLKHDVEAILGTVWIPAFAGMTEITQTLLQKNSVSDFARVRTSVTPEMVLIEVFECPDPASLFPLKCAIIEDWPRVAGDPLENCKRLDYTRSFAAREKAQSMGADEAILTNTNGNIACGATSNIFIEENGVLITPPLSEGVLAGITRAHLIADGAHEEIITKKRLIAADKAFLTNSIFGKREITLLR